MISQTIILLRNIAVSTDAIWMSDNDAYDLQKLRFTLDGKFFYKYLKSFKADSKLFEHKGFDKKSDARRKRPLINNPVFLLSPEKFSFVTVVKQW